MPWWRFRLYICDPKNGSHESYEIRRHFGRQTGAYA
jgi:hypothetical protein